MSDARARRILCDTYWSATGWRDERTVAPADFALARAAGYMFDAEWLGHDDVVARARAAASDLLPAEVGRAFAASLSTRRLEWRSALGSYAIARALPAHEPIGETFCAVCGTLIAKRARDLNVLSFERVKWGGVRHPDPEYQAFDLTRLAHAPEPQPTDEDWGVLRRLLDAISAAPVGARPGDLDGSLRSVLPSNSAERRILIQILAYAGVIPCSGYRSYAAGFVPASDRPDPPGHKNDWTYPAAWWRGGRGVDADVARLYFPDVYT